MALAQDEAVTVGIGGVLGIDAHLRPVGGGEQVEARERGGEVRRAGLVGHLHDLAAQLGGGALQFGEGGADFMA